MAHIVLIEDDPVQQMIIEQMLLAAHHEVTCFDNPQKALVFLQQSNPIKNIDLVLCDIMMPDLNGLDLKHALNATTAQQAPTAFIFITADHSPKTRAQALSVGVDDVLYKPIAAVELQDVVCRALARVAQWQRDWQRNITAQLANPLAPQLPSQLAGCHVAWSQTEVTMGGGDFLCHIPHAQGDLIVLADVMGHGMPAKFFAHAYMGYLYGVVRAQLNGCQQQTITPSSLLNKLQETYLQDKFLQRWQLTLQILQLQPTGEFLWAGAGHPSPYVWMAGHYYKLPQSGSLIGLMGNTLYKDYKGFLDKGQALVLYTDGALPQGLPIDIAQPAPSIDKLQCLADNTDDATLCVLTCGAGL